LPADGNLPAVALARSECPLGRFSPIPIVHARWPNGFVGSITHTDTYCAVAVARKADIQAIGIDLENPSRVTPELWSYVLSTQEIGHLERLEPALRQRVGALEFSAKEAFYKCIHDIAPGTLPFSDSVVELDEKSGRFVIQLLTVAGPFATGQAFTGRYVCDWDGDTVATAIVLPVVNPCHDFLDLRCLVASTEFRTTSDRQSLTVRTNCHPNRRLFVSLGRGVPRRPNAKRTTRSRQRKASAEERESNENTNANRQGDRGKGGFQMGKNCEERNLHRGPIGANFQFT